MPEIIEDFPPFEQPQETLHPKDIEGQAFYGAALAEGNPVDNYKQISHDLTVKGSSPLISSLNVKIKAETDKYTKEAVVSIINDDTIEPETKQKTLQQYAMSGTLEKSWRDRYISSTSIKDMADNTFDRSAQDVVVNTLMQREKTKAEEQMLINNYYSRMSPDKVKGLLGIVTELVPGIHGYSTTKLYDELVMKGEGTTWETVKNAIWGTGSTDRDIANFYATLPLEKKKDFTRKLIELGKDLPGFEFQQHQHVKEVLENSNSDFWENMGNVAGVLDAVGIGFMLRSPAKAVKWFKPADNFFSLKVPPRSPLGSAGIANPQVASGLAASAVMDESGQVAHALGTTPGQTLSWMIPKVDAEGIDAVPNLAEGLRKMETQLRETFDVNEFNPALYNVTSTQADVEDIYSFVRQSEYPVYNPGSSTFNVAELNNTLSTNSGYQGINTFGKTADYGWTSLEEAQQALAKQQTNLNKLPEELRGTLEIKELAPSQYFIQHKWNRKMDKVDLLMFGEDAISTKFLGIDVSKAARATGNWVWGSYDRVPNWVYGGATKSELTERALDQKFLKPLITEVAKNRFGKEIGAMLLKGGKTATANGGKVFTRTEFLDSFPKHSVEDVNEMYSGYRYARLIGDASYNFANRLDRSRKAADNMQAVYDANGSLARYAKVVSDEQAKGLTHIFDVDAGKVLKGSELQGQTVIKLEKAIENGVDLYSYSTLAKGERMGMLPQRTLPYLEGYFPRQYKEFFWVDVFKKGLRVDGEKVVDPKKVDQYKKAIYSSKTETEAKKFKAAFEKEHPEFEVSVRPDRMDHEQAAIDSYTAFSEAFQRAKSRGDHIITGIGELAETEDPLVALVKSVRSTAKRAAWADWKKEFQESFTREYSKFLSEGKFPRTLSDMVNLEHSSLEDTKAFKNAVENFKYYSEMVDMSELMSDRAWNSLMSGIADVLDSKSVWASSLLREVGRGGNLPVRALQKSGTILMIFTNPVRQLAIQSQQLFELGAMTPSAIRDMTTTHTGILIQMAADKLGGVVGDILRYSAEAMGRWGGYKPNEFRNIYKQFVQSGIPQGVDSNMILHGMFNQADQALTVAKGRGLAKAASQVGGVLSAPIKVGKLGFDMGELMNMTGAWLWARKRAINAGVDVNTPEALAQISIEARRITGSMTKTGAMEFQKGMLSIPLQFASVGHKLFLQPLSARNLSAADKGKLFATRAVFYGAYGTGAAAGIEYLRDKYYDTLGKDGWSMFMGGLMDYSWNNLLEWEFGKGEDLAVAPSLTPVSEYGLPYVEFMWQLLKEPEGFYRNVPFNNVAGRFSQAWYEMNALSVAEDIDTKQKASLAIDSVLRLTSGYSNYMQAKNIIATGKLVDKFGNDQDLEGSWKVAAGKILGFQTEGEKATFDVTNKLMHRDKDLQKDAKMFHNVLERRMREGGTYNDIHQYIKQEGQILKLIPDEDREVFLEHMAKEDKYSFKTRGVSVMLMLDKAIRSEANNDMIQLTKRLADTGVGPAEDLLKVLKTEGVVQ